MPTDEDKFCQYCIFPCNDLPSDHETSMYNAKGLLHMKKLLLVVVCLYMFVYGTYAQSPEIRAWEAEIGAGIAFGGNKLNFDHTYPGASFLMEGRYNLTRLPIDVGLQIHTNLLDRESEHAKKMNFKSWNIYIGCFRLQRFPYKPGIAVCWGRIWICLSYGERTRFV